MNTLKLEIKSLEIADNDTLIGGYENSRYFDFNEAFTTKIKLTANSEYRSLSFPQITSPFALIIVSDKEINAKINGHEFTNTRFIALNTSINSLEIANVLPDDASVSVLVWGEE